MIDLWLTFIPFRSEAGTAGCWWVPHATVDLYLDYHIMTPCCQSPKRVGVVGMKCNPPLSEVR